MSGFIKTLGVLFICLGIVGAVLVAKEIPFRDYQISKQVYEELPFNEYAEATYRQSLNAMMLSVGFAATVGLSGAATGAILLGLGSIIEKLDMIADRQRRVSEEQPGKQSQVLSGS